RGGHQPTIFRSISANLAVDDVPLCLATWLPSKSCFAVEQRYPAVVEQILRQQFRLTGEDPCRRNSDHYCRQNESYLSYAVHIISPLSHKGHEALDMIAAASLAMNRRSSVESSALEIGSSPCPLGLRGH